jgi:hypothetical protein
MRSELDSPPGSSRGICIALEFGDMLRIWDMPTNLLLPYDDISHDFMTCIADSMHLQ